MEAGLRGVKANGPYRPDRVALVDGVFEVGSKLVKRDDLQEKNGTVEHRELINVNPLLTSSPVHLLTSSPPYQFTSSPPYQFTSSPVNSSPVHQFTS